MRHNMLSRHRGTESQRTRRENAFLCGLRKRACGDASSTLSARRLDRVACVSALRSAFFVFVLLLAAVAHAQTAKPVATLKIGVTLHPYYSWTTNVVGNLPGYEVRALLPGDIDAGDYQPRPQDIKRLADLDVVIVNGIGHDDFIFPMLKASGNTKVGDRAGERGDAADSGDAAAAA